MGSTTNGTLILIELTAEAIRDYQVCSLYYDLRYNQQQSIPISHNKLFVQRFQNTMKRVISFYFFRRQAELPVSYNLLLSKWEKLWFPKGTDAFDLSIEPQDKEYNLSHYATIAAKSLLRFVDNFKHDKGYPLLIDESFTIPVSKKVKLSGHFDIILQYPGDEYKVIKWIFDRTTPIISDHMFSFVIQKLAWEYRNVERNRKLIASYYLYDLSNSSIDFVPVIPDQKDINAFMYWIKSIESNEIFIPRRGFTTYCRGCPFDEECKNFTFPAIGEYN